MRISARLATVTLALHLAVPAAHAVRPARCQTDDVKCKRRLALMTKLKAGIRPSMTRRTKLTRLMANLKKIGFKYLGSGRSADEIMAGGIAAEGDCGTLTKLFMKAAASYFQITDLTAEDKNDSDRIFVRGGGPIVDARRGRGNVDNGRHWYFRSHVWVVDPSDNNRAYDVLFNKAYASTDALKNVWTVIPPGKNGIAFKVGDVCYFENTVKTNPKNVLTSRWPSRNRAKPEGCP